VQAQSSEFARIYVSLHGRPSVYLDRFPWLWVQCSKHWHHLQLRGTPRLTASALDLWTTILRATIKKSLHSLTTAGNRLTFFHESDYGIPFSPSLPKTTLANS
jgi:hypothetical protein